MKYLFFIIFFIVQHCALSQTTNFDKNLYYAYVSNKVPLRIKFLKSKLDRMESLLYEQFDNFTNDINTLVLGKKDTLRMDTLYHISSWIPMVTIKDETCDTIFDNILYMWKQKAKKGIMYGIEAPCVNTRIKNDILTTDIIIEIYFGLSISCRITFIEDHYEKIPLEMLDVIQKDLNTLLKIKTKKIVVDKKIDINKLMIAVNKWKEKTKKLCKK